MMFLKFFQVFPIFLGTFELDQVLSIMRKFCTVCGAAVITTNHVVDWRGYAAPALGNAWISAIGTRVFLEYLEKCPDASGAADHSYELLATVINKQVAVRFSLLKRPFHTR